MISMLLISFKKNKQYIQIIIMITLINFLYKKHKNLILLKGDLFIIFIS